MYYHINSYLDIKTRDTKIIVDQRSVWIPGLTGCHSAFNKLVDQLLFVCRLSILLLSSLSLFKLWAGGSG